METICVQRPVVLYPGNNRPIQGPDFGGHRRFIFEVFKKGNFCVEFKGSLYIAAVISVNSNFEFLEKNKYPVGYTVFAL